jgi:hypothetical protein
MSWLANAITGGKEVIWTAFCGPFFETPGEIILRSQVFNCMADHSSIAIAPQLIRVGA